MPATLANDMRSMGVAAILAATLAIGGAFAGSGGVWAAYADEAAEDNYTAAPTGLESSTVLEIQYLTYDGESDDPNKQGVPVTQEDGSGYTTIRVLEIPPDEKTVETFKAELDGWRFIDAQYIANTYNAGSLIYYYYRGPESDEDVRRRIAEGVHAGVGGIYSEGFAGAQTASEVEKNLEEIRTSVQFRDIATEIETNMNAAREKADLENERPTLMKPELNPAPGDGGQAEASLGGSAHLGEESTVKPTGQLQDEGEQMRTMAAAIAVAGAVGVVLLAALALMASRWKLGKTRREEKGARRKQAVSDDEADQRS